MALTISDIYKYAPRSRETMTERNNNPFYFEAIQCEECGGTQELRLHKYSLEVKCEGCILLAKIEKLEEEHG